jgi:hypothetical protein
LIRAIGECKIQVRLVGGRGRGRGRQGGRRWTRANPWKDASEAIPGFVPWCFRAFLKRGLQCRGEKGEANEVRVKAEMGLVRDVA